MNLCYLPLALSLVSLPLVSAQDDLELRVQVLEAEVVQITDNVEDVETDVGGLDNEVTQITGQIFELGNDLNDVDDVNDLQEQRIGSLEEENSLLRLRLETLELLFSSLNGDVQVLNKTVSDLDINNSTNERLDALENDFTTLESDVTTLESNVTTLEGGFTQLESDVTTLEGDVTTLENDVTTLEGGLTQLESDVTTLKNEVTTLEGDLTALDYSTDQRLDILEENNGGNMDYSDTAFFATHSASSFVPTNPIVFDTPVFNSGSHYNPESGIYTVPVDGIYQFVMHYVNYGDTTSGVYLRVDNFQTALLYNIDDAYENPSAEMTILLSLTSGQQVWLTPSGISEMYGSSTGISYSWFSGHLIYPL